jgi:Flp pilus assembly pilin Flp
MLTSFVFFRAWVVARVRDDRAANLVEMSLLVGLIALVCVAAVMTYGRSLSRKYSTIDSAVAP